jgi:hypothetical protein
MKLTISLLFISLFLVVPAMALTVMHKVDSPQNCPESLQVQSHL